MEVDIHAVILYFSVGLQGFLNSNNPAINTSGFHACLEGSNVFGKFVKIFYTDDYPPNKPDLEVMDYRREIDGLRALAVLPVILFHAGFQSFSGGFVGVDVFFVISGYLITSIILSELQAGEFSLIRFYERRARRILPALFLVMFMCLPFAWFWLLPNDLKSFSQSLVAVSSFASNILFWRTSDYFEPAAELKPLLHTWSLAVEEQYYVFFPILLMLAWRFGKNVIIGILVFAFVLSLTAAQWGSTASPEAAFYLLPTRGWELLIGAFVAFYLSSSQEAHWHKTLMEVGGLVGLASILYSNFVFDNRIPFPSLYTLVPTIGTALIILCSSQATIVGKLLGMKWPVAIGLISYSAYLWHQPLLAFAKHRTFDEPSVLLLGGMAFASLALAFFSWKYVEKPFRNKERFKRSDIFKIRIIGNLFFILIGLTGHFTKGFENRFNYVVAYEGDIGRAEYSKYFAEKYFNCGPDNIVDESLNSERCMKSKRDVEVDIAILGDSHAQHLFLGIADELKDKNMAFYVIKGSHHYHGNAEFDNVFKHILETTTIKTVLLASHWTARVDQLPASTTFERELLTTINKLMAAGKSVYLFDDVPKFPFPAERCKFIVEGMGKVVCDTSKAQIMRYEARYLPILRNISSDVSGVRFLEIRDLFCDESKCSMVKNNLLMYRDNNHLNIPGSQYVGREIVKHFPELR